MSKICPVCGKRFTAKTISYCSWACYQKANPPRTPDQQLRDHLRRFYIAGKLSREEFQAEWEKFEL